MLQETDTGRLIEHDRRKTVCLFNLNLEIVPFFYFLNLIKLLKQICKIKSCFWEHPVNPRSQFLLSIVGLKKKTVSLNQCFVIVSPSSSYLLIFSP